MRLAGILADHGVDLIDVSTGGTSPLQKIRGGPAYQAPFAEAVKKAHGDKIIVGTVGAITDGKTAQGCLDKVRIKFNRQSACPVTAEMTLMSCASQGQADVVMAGRAFQKNPGLVWQFAEDLGVTITVAHQIQWGFKGRGKVGRKTARL